MQQIHMQTRVDAPPQTVWDLYTDHVGWMEWAGVKEVVLRQQGDPAPNGLGAIRVIRAGGIAVEEEVTAFDAPKRMVYRISVGMPVRNHEGVVRFEPREGGTLVSWDVRFDALIPGTGWLLARGFQRALQGILDRLAERLSR